MNDNEANTVSNDETNVPAWLLTGLGIVIALAVAGVMLLLLVWAMVAIVHAI